MTDRRPKDKVWGDFTISNRPIPRVPDADHILGARVLYDIHGKPDAVHFQYMSTDGLQELRMNFGNAMFLLSLVKSIQLDTGTPFPDDPRA